MSSELRQLARDVAEALQAPPPPHLDDDAPLLTDAALGPQEMYIVGLIGGKEVGKSALTNALAGRDISEQTDWGPGTEQAVAYVHRDTATALRALLEENVPGRYRLVLHDHEALRQQVLLDLPDIDSHYASHVEIARRMLRHMLYPIWVQSVEKYADARPAEMLRAVAAGNDPRNFLFCLNKMDQVVEAHGADAAEELRQDCARRIGEALGLEAPPRIWLTSAIRPGSLDLPELKSMLSRQKDAEDVRLGRERAGQRMGLTLSQWIARQELPRRLRAAEALEADARELLAERVGGPLVDEALPALLDDPALRLGIADELLRMRVRRWPVVNILHALAGPLMALVRRRLSLQTQRGLEGEEPLVDLHIARGSDGMPGVAGGIQSALAALQQTHPQTSTLYRQRRLWEPGEAEAAEIELRRLLAGTLRRQREALAQRLARGGGPIGALFRWGITVGAILWFTLAQPMLVAWMKSGVAGLGVLAVELLGVGMLLRNLGFLVFYFAILWLSLKWDTQRRVDRALDHWKRDDSPDADLSLAAQAMAWLERLLAPAREHQRRLQGLVERCGQLARTDQN